jgi:RNA polymerase sigma factor (sigma-70 family)
MRKGGFPMSLSTEFAPVADGVGELSDSQLVERFVARQDAAAFATLIQRHGSMVLGVCRRVLNHEQEAEDAFQATFLVLVRRAASLERPNLLGNWLYGVAYRTAQKARARLARRRHHERRVEPMQPSDPPDDLQWNEVRGVLDEELQHLPMKYRTPLVLCYLEGMTNEEAARRLGWPAGSMSYRLARGRQLLRERLCQRRQVIPGVVLLSLLREHAGPQDVPESLARATLRAALSGADKNVPPLPPLIPSDGRVAPSQSTGTAIKPRRRSPWTLFAIALATVSLGGVLYLAAGGLGEWIGGSTRAGGTVVVDEQPASAGSPPTTGTSASCH